MRVVEPSSSFFVSGGTVPPGSPSYVERAADRELYDALIAGEYCYVLNSRQMGKSSLAVRTVERLQASGVRTAFVDLTRIGGANVTAEQWYAGLLAETGRVLGLRSQAGEFLREHRELGSAQRFLAFLQEIALAQTEAPLVVMIDEIDAIRSLSFSTDELFAGIRQLHNGRASEPALKRLTFCLLGAALPSDLIRDPRTTPFNVGRRIELRDFTPEEAGAFARGLSLPAAEQVVERVLYWTGGHPFLTQTLCSGLAADPGISVDRIVQERYLDSRAKETDTNLADIGNRLLGRGDPGVSDSCRADTLSLFAEFLKRGIPDDESNPNGARIKMSGVARLDDARLAIRNRIYAHVFDPAWVRANMPGQELRRQRRAYYTGVVRTGAVAGAVIAVIGTLAILAIQNARRANRAETQARRDNYASTMRNMIQWEDQSDLFLIDRATAKLANDPWKGWEWLFWHRIANRASRVIPFGKYSNGAVNVSPNGKLALTCSPLGLSVVDLTTRATLWNRPLKIQFVNMSASWSRDSSRIIVYPIAGEIRIFDAKDGRLLESRSGLAPLVRSLGFGPSTFADDTKQIVIEGTDRPAVMDLRTFKLTPIASLGDRYVNPGAVVSADGTTALIACGVEDDMDTEIAVWDPRTGQTRSIIQIGKPIGSLAISDNARVGIATAENQVILVDPISGRVLDREAIPGGAAAGASCSSDGKLALATGPKREAVLYTVSDNKLTYLRSFMESAAGSILPHTHQVVTAFWDIRIEDADAGVDVPEIRLQNAGFFTGAITKEGILIENSGRMLSHASLVSPHIRLQQLPARGLRLFDSKGKTTLVWSPDHMKIVDALTGKLISFWPHGVGSPAAYDRSADGRYCTLLTDLDTLNLVDESSHGSFRKLDVGSRPVAAAFSDDSKSVAVAGMDGSISLFDIASIGPKWQFRPEGWRYDSLSFSPDGHWIAAANDGDTGEILDAATGKPVAQLVGHVQGINCFAWSPDGRRLATGSIDNTIHLWDPATGDDLGIIGRHEGAVFAMQFLPGGRTLASFSTDGVAKLSMTEDRR